MTIPEAKIIVDNFHNNTGQYTEEELFLYTEAAQFLIRETGDPFYMMALGAQYYDMKKYDLALKYYEMAAELGNERAALGLGYIWYYGRTGTVDYKKAFRYFLQAKNDLNAQYKLADMFHNGYYVEKDESRYREMIEQMYREHYGKTDAWNNASIAIRLAKIRAEEGDKEESVSLLLEAKEDLAYCISINPFFGTFSLIQGVIRLLYELRNLDTGDLDFFDLYEVLRKPARVRFRYNGKVHDIESSEEEGGSVAVCLDGKWYRSVNDMMMNANTDGALISQDPWSVEDIRIIE